VPAVAIDPVPDFDRLHRIHLPGDAVIEISVADTAGGELPAPAVDIAPELVDYAADAAVVIEPAMQPATAACWRGSATAP
jgi:hypothetical protein